MLDNLFQKLFEKGLSNSTVKYTQRVLSVSMEAARQYRYIETNPARDVITKFGKQGKIPDPYTIEQMQQFMSKAIGTEWETPVVLAGLYGLRMSEIFGLRLDNIDLKKMQFGVVGQLPFRLPPGTKLVSEMVPTKSNDRILPITEITLPYFLRRVELIEKQKELRLQVAANTTTTSFWWQDRMVVPIVGTGCQPTLDNSFVIWKCLLFTSMICAIPQPPTCTSSSEIFAGHHKSGHHFDKT